MISELDNYPVTLELDVRWGDMDAMGHVNNTVFFQYFESARIHYQEVLNEQGNVWPDSIGPIVASTSCDFELPITHPDELLAGARVSEFGEKKYTMEHAVYSKEHEALAAEGETILVSYNYSSSEPVSLPESIKQSVKSLEDGRLQAHE